MRESLQDRNKRLKRTAQGKVIIALLAEYGSSVALAKAAGVNPDSVARWIAEGKISMRGATSLAEATGRDRKEFRPDLSDADWPTAFPGPVPGAPPKNWTKDAKLLIKAAKKNGPVSALCESLGISVGNFHTWKTRGKIPAAHRAAIEALAK